MNLAGLMSLSVALLGVMCPQPSAAFSTTHGVAKNKRNSICNSRLDTSLQGGLFGGVGDAVKNMMGGDNNNQNGGPKTVFEIPVDNIKQGPLRFFLQIYIVGQKNSQDSQTWLPREAEDGGLEVYFKDATGMCKIALEPNAIKAERHGQKPSLQYILQESVMLHGILDELNTIAFEADVEDDSKRLLLVEDGAIDKARETLPARQE